MWCSAVQCVVVGCRVFEGAAVHGSAWQCVAVRGSAWQCVAVRGSAWQCVAVCSGFKIDMYYTYVKYICVDALRLHKFIAYILVVYSSTLTM